MAIQLKKKNYYQLDATFLEYLGAYERAGDQIPPIYEELIQFDQLYPHIDDFGNHTNWMIATYARDSVNELYKKLAEIYARLKTGDIKVAEHLYIERIDFCEFGNSRPFRIRIVNQYNDNYDHFYVKVADANRIYGLELEHILSPNRMNYFVSGETLIEEHIAGLPGDLFVKEWIDRDDSNHVRLAKEFVKFSERTFIRLLGDMRSYNYVVDITPDFETLQYRVRAIDFDQQCYEGDRKHYMPGHFEDNARVVALCAEHINANAMTQYQNEERNLIRRRLNVDKSRIKNLINCMRENPCTTEEKTRDFVTSLNEFHQTKKFEQCKTVADILELNIHFSLDNID